MKKIYRTLFLAMCGILSYASAEACTNFIVTKGASTDGSVMVSYAADSHQLYGCLYHHAGGRHKSQELAIYEWDTGKFLGNIGQVPTTYSTIGNMNEHSLIIGETTYGGRHELAGDQGIDYGSMIYITLQRAKTAREAIQVMADLANTYGYASSGESMSIADQNEAWIMELIGKGPGTEGIVWVARRIPDGYVSAHANQARITTFPLNDPENCLYSEDVISFARERGYFEGEDSEFSFADAYAPLDFMALRACEARVWSFFRTVADDMDQYEDYAMGYNKQNRMPLWVKPSQKVAPKVLFDAMRDHYEGTKMDMTQDIGAGGCGMPYRWRDLTFEVDGKTYLNERATATQQTGFWFVAQARPSLPSNMGILWFGVDDAATSPLTPIYCSVNEVPENLLEGNGTMLDYSPTSMFWLNNRITNLAYGIRYDMMSREIRNVIDEWENSQLAKVQEVDAEVVEMSAKKQQKVMTAYSVATSSELFAKWQQLDQHMLLKYMDGNVKSEKDGEFEDNGNGKHIPGNIQYPGYNEKWRRAVANDNGEILEVK